jgi:hypothetical protein
MGKWLAALLALTMVIVAGCQAVGGVDLNRVLKNSLQVTSMEGKQTLEFELLVNDEFKAMAAEDSEDGETAVMLELLSKVKLTLDTIKVKDAQHASMAGSLALGDLAIGFDLKMAGDLTIIELEGAKEPIVLEMTPDFMSSLFPELAYISEDMSESGMADEKVQAELTELGKGIIEDVGGYVIDNLPNPERISVTAGMESVGGQDVFLSHIDAEIDGKELWQWINKYLDALIADEAGLTEMMTALIERIQSHDELFLSLGIPVEEDVLGLGQSKEDAIAEGIKEMIDALKEAKAELKAAEEEDPESLAMVFNEDSSLKVDVYVDTKLDVRKSAFELVVKPTMPDQTEDLSMMGVFAGIEGIRIAGTSEQWNVNGDVVPDAPVKPENGLTMDEMDGMKEYEMIRFFDKESDIYDLLTNKLHLNRQEITLFTDYSYNPPIITPSGRTLVPLRSVAEELGADLTYDGSTKKMKLVDGATGTTILLKTGSDQVTIDGAAARWSFPVTLMQDGTVYVPARDLVAALDGTLRWDTFFDEERILVIEREIE